MLNTWTLIPFLSSIILILWGNFIFYRNSKETLNRIFTVYCFLGAYHGFCQFMLQQAESAHSALVWTRLSWLWTFILPLGLHFVLTFTENLKTTRRKLILIPVIYGPSLLFLYLGSFTNLINNGVVEKYWGYAPVPVSSLLIASLVGWTMIWGFLLPTFLVKSYCRKANQAKQKQSKFIIIGMAVQTITGIISEGILPALGFNIPPLTTISRILQGGIIGYAMWKYDLFIITPAKAAENIVSTMVDPLFLLDGDGIILRANCAASKLFNRNDLLSKSIIEILPMSATELEEIKRMHRDGIRDKEMEVSTMGDIHLLSISISPIRSTTERLVGFVCIAHDITDRRKAEMYLKQRNQEIVELTNSIVHDLKKPLTTVWTVHSLLTTKLSASQGLAELLDTCGKALDYMQNLLADLMECAMLDAGARELEREDVNIGELVRGTLQKLSPQIVDKNIIVTAAANIKVRADACALSKVFMNLVGNAVNYIGTGPKREIKIGTRCVGTERAFFVQDTGIGIPADSLVSVFQKFKRGKNVKGISGTGLGLAIVKGIVEAHGGRVWVETKEGLGSTFYFTLPMAA